MTPLHRLAATIEARKSADPATSWTAKLLSQSGRGMARQWCSESTRPVCVLTVIRSSARTTACGLRPQLPLHTWRSNPTRHSRDSLPEERTPSIEQVGERIDREWIAPSWRFNDNVVVLVSGPVFKVDPPTQEEDHRTLALSSTDAGSDRIGILHVATINTDQLRPLTRLSPCRALDKKTVSSPSIKPTGQNHSSEVEVDRALAVLEPPLRRDRTGLGRIAAKKRGVKFGRKPKLTPEQIILALRLVDDGQSVPQVADAFGVHETTIYRCLSAAEAAA